MIPELLQRAKSLDLRPGECLECHAGDDGGPAVPRRIIPSDRFIRKWGYALLGRQWDEQVHQDELPEIDRSLAYVGIVHEEGALLVAFSALGGSR